MNTYNNQRPIDQEICYSVTELNNEISLFLDKTYGYIYVEGEISNLARPISGHLYFSLKDKNAQVKCALFRNALNKINNIDIKNGSKVILKAKVSLYAPRGDYQLIVYDLFESGFGQLQKEFLELKNKLEKQGFFELANKKAFPKLPKTAAIITSSTGAAIKDILTTIKRRWPLLNVIIIPTVVQGESSSVSITNAINQVNQYSINNLNIIDCIILSRGGGSIEDLWGFNAESVAQAIYNSNIPIVTGIGHEIDFTIADFVADHRAATPTAAAEFITPNKIEYLNLIFQKQLKLNKNISYYLKNNSKKLEHIKHRLNIQNPINKLNNQIQKLDHITSKLIINIEKYLNNLNNKIQNLNYQLKILNPEKNLNNNKSKLEKLSNKLSQIIKVLLTNKQHEIKLLAQNLDNISPLKILSRGYSITKNIDGKNIKSISQLNTNDKIETILTDGNIISIVCEIVRGQR